MVRAWELIKKDREIDGGRNVALGMNLGRVNVRF